MICNACMSESLDPVGDNWTLIVHFGAARGGGQVNIWYCGECQRKPAPYVKDEPARTGLRVSADETHLEIAPGVPLNGPIEESALEELGVCSACLRPPGTDETCPICSKGGDPK